MKKANAEVYEDTNSIPSRAISSSSYMQAGKKAAEAGMKQLNLDKYIEKIGKDAMAKVKDVVGEKPVAAIILSAKIIKDRRISVENLRNPYLNFCKHDISLSPDEVKINVKFEF